MKRLLSLIVTLLLSVSTISYAKYEMDLIRAARNGDILEVRSLLNMGVDVDAKDNNGETALITASSPYQGNIAIIETLIKRGANINAKNNDGWTALMIASSYIGNINIVKLLLINGADVNARNHEGGTALYSAAVFGNIGIVNVLLDSGANVNVQNDRGFTPLIVAAMGCHTQVVKALLANGADVNVKSGMGKTALSVAENEDCHEIVRLIKKRINGSTETKDIPSTMSVVVATETSHQIGRYIDHGDGTITDIRTGLMWVKKDSYSELARCLNWNESNDYVRRLKVGGHRDWRLPTVQELKSLIDPSKKHPSGSASVPMYLDPVFTAGEAYGYWSSERELSCCPLVVYFSGYGVAGRGAETCIDGPLSVRAVRKPTAK